MKHLSFSTYFVTAALILVGASAAAAHLPPDLAKAVADYDAAQIKGDGAELTRLLADDYTLLNSSGATETKAQFIADSTAPGFKLDPFVVQDPIEKVWADGAVMGGIATLRGVDAGKRFEATIRFADIWAKRHGVWRVIYTHVSKPAK
jgi:hypothetical protein